MTVKIKALAGTEYTFFDANGIDYTGKLTFAYEGPAERGDLYTVGDAFVVSLLDKKLYFHENKVTLVQDYTQSNDLKTGSREMFQFKFDGIGNGFDIQFLEIKRAYHVNHSPTLRQFVYGYIQALEGVTIDNVLAPESLVAKYITNGVLLTLWETVEMIYKNQKNEDRHSENVRAYDLK